MNAGARFVRRLFAFGAPLAGSGLAGAYATVITVGSTGCDYTDLQTAIDNAQPDDELRLRLEIFTGANVNIDKDLVIIGGYVNCGDMLPDVGNPTTLQGGAGDSVIEIEGTFNSVQLTNLLITGGENDADFGGGIGVGVASSINMSFVTVDGNDSLRGGGIFLDDNGGYTVMFDGRFIGNDAASAGGGLYYGGPGDVVFDGLILNSNTAGSFGGGLYQRQGRSDTVFLSATIWPMPPAAAPIWPTARPWSWPDRRLSAATPRVPGPAVCTCRRRGRKSAT